MLQIGNLKIEGKPLLLAPMEDISSPSFRYICKYFGADMMYTEFISSDGLVHDGKKSLRKLEILDSERPIGIQLYGHLMEPMIEATKMATAANPEVIDINYGCPVRKIANRGAGAGMLRDIPKMVEMTRAVVNSTHIPVTVKTRLGWDEDSKNIVEIAERLQDVGIQALTIHGRTRSQFYKGQADWTLIGEVKNNPRMHIPVIGNGDVDSPQIAAQMFNRYGVDAIMIGRATVGRPWIFKEIKDYIENDKLWEGPSLREKVSLARLHLKKSLEEKGHPRGIFEMRRHFVHYFKGLSHFKNFRIQLLTTTDENEIDDILTRIEDIYAAV